MFVRIQTVPNDIFASFLKYGKGIENNLFQKAKRQV